MHMKLPVKLAPVAIIARLQLALVLPGTHLALAQDAKPADAKPTDPPPKKKWESVASADLTLTRGNSRSFLATATLNTQRKWESEELLLGASAGYGNSSAKNSNGQEVTTENQDYLKGFAQFNHLFSDRFYAGLRLEALHDNVADLNYRFTVSPMAGYYFIKHTNTFLSGEVGPSLVDEELGHHTQTYMGLRLGERFEHKFDGGAKIWQSLEWIPQVDKFDNWILNAEAGVSAPITKSLDVRLIAQDTYNNQPAPGRLKNDLKLLAGIGYRF
jgi:putative salt-induced outer membrane protein YdiY